jgi:hypothetical protein
LFSETLEGEWELAAFGLDENLWRVTLTIRNLSRLLGNSLARTRDPDSLSRERTLLRSFVSVHSILQVAGGEFVSLLDPPEHWKAAAAGCRNVGTWPVLAGEEGRRDLLLSSPIILYDYRKSHRRVPRICSTARRSTKSWRYAS